MTTNLRNSEIDRILNCEQKSDDTDADPTFEVYSDHDSNSECGFSEEEPDNLEPELHTSYSVDDQSPIASTSSAERGSAAPESDVDTGDMMKPSIITYYNKTKGGVDVCDAMCGEYTVARGTKR
ncbi:hypothetical protein J6590_064739 [Homalodisca vitripennis]|nr:hypothetical protein J6590_064739 [Homalodisca vitripennis]